MVFSSPGIRFGNESSGLDVASDLRGKGRALAGSLGRRICFFGFGAVASLGMAFGQAEDAEKSRGEFWVAAWKEPIAETLSFSGSESEGKLAPIPWMQRSGPYRRPKGEINFYEGELPGKDQSEEPKAVASIKISEEVKRPLLIFIPVKQGVPKRYSIAVVDDDPSQFPFGSYRFQNLTRFPISGSVGVIKFQVEPNTVVGIRPDAGKVEDLPVKAAMLEDKKTVPVMDTMWTYEPKLRKHIIFSEGQGGRGIELQSLVEYENKK